jgi:hypothetical protein
MAERVGPIEIRNLVESKFSAEQLRSMSHRNRALLHEQARNWLSASAGQSVRQVEPFGESEGVWGNIGTGIDKTAGAVNQAVVGMDKWLTEKSGLSQEVIDDPVTVGGVPNLGPVKAEADTSLMGPFIEAPPGDGEPEDLSSFHSPPFRDISELALPDKDPDYWDQPAVQDELNPFSDVLSKWDKEEFEASGYRMEETQADMSNPDPKKKAKASEKLFNWGLFQIGAGLGQMNEAGDMSSMEGQGGFMTTIGGMVSMAQGNGLMGGSEYGAIGPMISMIGTIMNIEGAGNRRRSQAKNRRNSIRNARTSIAGSINFLGRMGPQ